jgi:glycerol kinase
MADAMVEASRQPLVELRADGGAAAMELLLQLQADQIRIPVSRPASLESTALGAARLAGLAEGLWGSLDELASSWRAETTKEPVADPALADALYESWRRGVERSRSWASS